MQAQRLMGEGYEPYVEQQGDRLTYSLPVDSGFVSFNFTFDLRQTDLDVLLSSDYRRAVLEITAHTLLQHSTLKGNDRFTQKKLRQPGRSHTPRIAGAFAHIHFAREP